MFEFKVGDKVRTLKGDRAHMYHTHTRDMMIKITEVGKKWGKAGGNVYDAVLGCKRNARGEWSKPHVYLVKNLRHA